MDFRNLEYEEIVELNRRISFLENKDKLSLSEHKELAILGGQGD